MSHLALLLLASGAFAAEQPRDEPEEPTEAPPGPDAGSSWGAQSDGDTIRYDYEPAMLSPREPAVYVPVDSHHGPHRRDRDWSRPDPKRHSKRKASKKARKANRGKR